MPTIKQEVLHVIKGDPDLAFTAHAVHSILLKGGYSTIAATLAKLTRQGIIRRVGYGYYTAKRKRGGDYA